MKCPYQDVCSTTVRWSMELRKRIEEICDVDKHKNCFHYENFHRNPKFVAHIRKELKHV